MRPSLAILLSVVVFSFTAKAQVVVTSPADDGSPSTLRYAVENATNGESINFAANLSGQAILLTNGQINLTNSILIDGSGLTSDVQLNGLNASRIFQVSSNANVVLNSLVLTNGNYYSYFYNNAVGGGAIYSEGTLTLNNCIIVSNTCSWDGAGIDGSGSIILNNCTFINNYSEYNGGGVDLESGNLAVSNCVFAGNVANNGGLGGGICIQSGTASVNSTVLNANLGWDGGGISSSSGFVYMNNCTISGNSAINTDGGGVCGGDTFVLNQCTVVSNVAPYGGGISVSGALTLNQCTVVGNTAFEGSGGGIYIFHTMPFQVTNTIVALNTANNDPDIDGLYFSPISGSNNFIGGDPKLAPLGDYGGLTQTMPPLNGSPAIDAGTDLVTNWFSADGRGYPRLAGQHVDIGAVEGIYVASGPGQLTGTTTFSDGSVQFGFTNFSDASFPVLASTNLTQCGGGWTQIGFTSEVPPGSGQFQFTDPQAQQNYPQRFYRVRSP